MNIVHTGELTELAAAIRTEAETLYKSWLGTSERVRDWQQQIATATKVGVRILLARGHRKRISVILQNHVRHDFAV